MIDYNSFVVPSWYMNNILTMRRTKFINEYFKTNGFYPTESEVLTILFSDDEKEEIKKRFYAKSLAKEITENNQNVTPPIEEINEIKVGDKLPSFLVTMNDGKQVTDETLQGNVSVIVFFHTSCSDCQKVLPHIQRLYDEYWIKGTKFAVISRECSGDAVKGYWTDRGFNMPYSAQEDRTIYNLFAPTRMPRVYIIDRDGIVRYIFTDDPLPSYDELKESLISLLTIDVNANNISGTWVDINNENRILTLVRNDRTYTLQTGDTTITGQYTLQGNENGEVVIRGNIDYDAGEWEHRYIIQDLTETSMKWIATDDNSVIYEFIREI